MTIDIMLIQKLRAATGVGMMDAKKALEEQAGNFDRAIDHLKKQGQKIAAKKKDRETSEGVVGSYVHANGKVAALVAVTCESDFVANTEDFKTLAHELAMQVAAADPLYINPEEVPGELVEKERILYREQLATEGKPEQIQDKIIEGKLKKYYSEICLIKQPYIKEEKQTIEQLIQEQMVKLGENIQIKSFKRIAL